MHKVTLTRNIDEGNLCFQLMAPEELHTITAQDEKEKNHWTEEIDDVIKKLEETKKVFRMPLKALVQRDKDSDIPVFVSNAIQFLMDNALSMEGIFRKSGLQTDIEALKYLVDSGAPLNWTGGDKRVGPNNIAGLLKLWFREMPEPLLTYGLYDHFMQMLTLESDRVPYLKTLVDRLPPENRNLLQHLFKMLVAVTKHQDKNLMSAKNLAIVFGPNLLKPKPENNPGRLLENSLEISPIEDGLMDPTSLAKVAAVTEVMLSNYDQIFNTVEEERRQKKEELKAQQDEKLKVQKEKQEQTSTQLQKATIVMEQGIKQKQKDKKNAAVPALGAVAYQGYLKWKGKKKLVFLLLCTEVQIPFLL